MKVIQKIQIRHFRSIFEEDFEDLNHMNIFGGQNDSGKSNVLKALNLFFNNQTSFLEDFNFFSDFSMHSKVKVRESKKGRQYISIKIFFDLSETKGKDALKKLAEENGGLWVERRWWQYNGDGLYEQVLPPYITSAKQGVKRSFSVFLQSIKFVYIPAFKDEKVFSHVLKLSAQNNGLFLDETAKNKLNKNINEVTQQMSKDFSDITKIKTFVTLPIGLETFWTSLEINSQFEGTPTKIKRGTVDDYKIKFSSRGDGIKSLFIPVILGWLSRSAKENYWIWGIDEPENSLEAIRAEKLFKKFQEYSETAQIFLSTHSPSFIFPQDTENNKSKVFVVSQTDPGETKFQIIDNKTTKLESIFGYDYGSFLNLQKSHSEKIEELEKTKNEISEIKKNQFKGILFVEGITDKKILENSWNKLYPKEDKNFDIFDKNDAHGVAYALESSEVFSKKYVFGLFDFDYAGFTSWNGLKKKKYKEISDQTDLLYSKKENKKHYALLLPVPVNLNSQVIDPKSKKHFGDKAILDIELMFSGIADLSSHFEIVDAPGGGTVTKFKGNKVTFTEKTKDFKLEYFENFKPLFEKIILLMK